MWFCYPYVGNSFNVSWKWACVSVGLCPGLPVVTVVCFIFALCITTGEKIPKTLFFVMKTAKI